jgi:hypothetical protein
MAMKAGHIGSVAFWIFIETGIVCYGKRVSLLVPEVDEMRRKEQCALVRK